MSDIVTRLLLKTNDFDANLEKSKGSVNRFQGGVSDMAKSVGSSFMKVAGGIGLAISVGEGFNKVINSSQTLSDEYSRTMNGLKGVVDEFFYSIGSGDWNNFFNGLDDTIRKAREAYNAIDQLGNTKMSYGYFNMKNQAGIQEQITILKDKDSTDEQKKAAREAANKILEDQKEITEQLNRRSTEALQALVAQGTGLEAADVSMMDVDKAIRYDVSAMGDEEKAERAKEYEAYLKEIARLKDKYTNKNKGKDNIFTNMYQGGVGYTEVNTFDTEGYKKALAPVLGQYQDAIMYNKILVKESDDWLQNSIGIRSEAFNAERAYSSMAKAVNRASQSGIGGNKTPNPKKDSIAWYDAEISKLNKKLIATTDEQVKTTIKTTINELEAKKIKLQVETSGNSIEAINIQLSALNKNLITETDMQARATIQATINELEQKKINLKFVVDQEAFKIAHGEMRDGALSVPIAPAYDKVPTHGKGGKNFKLPKYNPLFKKEDVDLNEDYADSLSAIGSVMSALNGVTNESAASYLQWGANVISSIAQAIPAILSLTTAKTAEAAANSANSAAQIPFVGWLAAAGAALSVVAAMASIPKFATGGIVPGASFTGDKVPALLNSGEMILNGSQQSNLFKMLNSGLYGSLSQKIAPSMEDQSVRLYSDVEIRGDRIFLALQNHIKKTGKKLW